MATSTEVAIATTTLGSAASTITFSSIPSTYTDLRLVLVGTVTNTTNDYNVNVQLNSDSGSNYSQTVLYGTGSAAGSLRESSQTVWHLVNGTGIKNNTPSMYTLDIQSYAGSTYKTALGEHDADYNGSGSVTRKVHLWRSTSAVTSIAITTDATNFATGTTATLYGIL